MIDWIAIDNFAITSSVELELSDGFTAVTGETGSGKSLMVDALAVLLGGRAENSIIQFGKESAEIQCSFDLPDNHLVSNWLKENELFRDNELILKRVIRRDKPSRGFINNRPVNISQLRDVGAFLVDIHGQHEHHSLVKRPVQRALIDEVCGNEAVLQKLDQSYTEISDVKNQLQRLNQEEVSTQERIDLLSFQLIELDELNPEDGEWEQLESQQKRLANTQELTAGCQGVVTKLYGDDTDDVHSVIAKLIGQLESLLDADANLQPIITMLTDASVNVEESAEQLRQMYESYDLDHSQLEEIEQRFASYHSLARKHRVQPNVLAAHCETLRSELAGLSNPDEERKRLDLLLQQTIESYQKLSKKLTQSRQRTAKTLGGQIKSVMQELGMEGGQFEIKLLPLESDQLSRYGNEIIEFHVSANAGMPLQPLSKVASGGEISRIALAIQVIMANSTKIPTLVFDEVDVGIGGTVANIVGKHLYRLGQSSQVICVTHLPQVAACAKQQFAVSKASQNSQSTEVSITALDHEQRIAEIARMSGSTTLTQQSRAHAEQLLATTMD